MRRAGERVRITAQLIEAATGAHLWAERYDRSLDDIFAVQDEVAQTIVSTLVGRIEDARLQQSLRKPTASLAAYDCLLRGLAHFRGDADERQSAGPMRCSRGRSRSIRDMPWRIRISPSSRWRMHGHAAAPTEVLDAAFAEARHALELDPQESRCHRILSTICLYRREYDMAEQHIRRAFDLNPNDAEAMTMKGRLLALRGRPEEALVCLEAAVRLNPLHPTWYNAHFGIALYSLRRFAEAAQALKRMPRPRLLVDVRGSRPATPSLDGRAEAQAAAARSCGCSPTSRRPSSCARASSLNAPKTGSFSAKG